MYCERYVAPNSHPLFNCHAPQKDVHFCWRRRLGRGVSGYDGSRPTPLRHEGHAAEPGAGHRVSPVADAGHRKLVRRVRVAEELGLVFRERRSRRRHPRRERRLRHRARAAAAAADRLKAGVDFTKLASAVIYGFKTFLRSFSSKTRFR
jgi:hypothetical protein